MNKQDRNRNFAALAAGLMLAGALVVATPATAADMPPETKAALDAARAELRADRETLLAINLDLTSAQADQLWPLYREYSGKRAKLGDELIAMIADYGAAYPAVSDAVAKDLVARSLKYDRGVTDLRSTYAKKFGKVLSATQLMRLLQIERRVDTLILLEVMKVVPVVEPPAK